MKVTNWSVRIPLTNSFKRNTIIFTLQVICIVIPWKTQANNNEKQIYWYKHSKTWNQINLYGDSRAQFLTFMIIYRGTADIRNSREHKQKLVYRKKDLTTYNVIQAILINKISQKTIKRAKSSYCFLFGNKNPNFIYKNNSTLILPGTLTRTLFYFETPEPKSSWDTNTHSTDLKLHFTTEVAFLSPT